MKIPRLLISWRRLQVALAFLLVAASGQAGEVPVRLSFKFILNTMGSRPFGGSLTDETDIQGQVDHGNQILAGNYSEFLLENIEVVDVPGVPQWYLTEITLKGNEQVDLMNAALANKALYHWRDNAINVYINCSQGVQASGVARFPPNNRIILLSQGVYNDVLMHEVGHCFNLMHTHEPPDDDCGDTLPDNQNWTRDQLSTMSYGLPYASLSATHKAAVDLVWHNVMSYHDPNSQYLLSPCQKDRMSLQAWLDQSWLLSRLPVYVDSSFQGNPMGIFIAPFKSIDTAIFSGRLANQVLVLESGTHSRPLLPFPSPMAITCRRGPALVQCAPAAYNLPYALEYSTNPAVRQAVILGQQCDRKKDAAGAMKYLLQAESAAAGREKLSLQLALARRHKKQKHFTDSTAWLQKVAQAADQESLRAYALNESARVEKEASANPGF
jgi:hypothetical protein